MPKNVCGTCNNIYQDVDGQYKCKVTDNVKDMFDSCNEWKNGVDSDA